MPLFFGKVFVMLVYNVKNKTRKMLDFSGLSLLDQVNDQESRALVSYPIGTKHMVTCLYRTLVFVLSSDWLILFCAFVLIGCDFAYLLPLFLLGEWMIRKAGALILSAALGIHLLAELIMFLILSLS